MNNKPGHIRKWFNSNKPVLNANKKFTLFHKLRREDDIPRVPVLKIDTEVIERISSIKFLGVLLDKHLTWNHHSHLLQSQISKNIALCVAKNYLNQNYFKSTYYSFVHSCLYYGNIAWASTSKKKSQNNRGSLYAIKTAIINNYKLSKHLEIKQLTKTEELLFLPF